MKKFLLIALSLGSVVSAYASYDLVMATDYNNKVVRRFDGTSGAYLGSFGQGFLEVPGSIAIDASLNRAYVLDRVNKNIWVFNYNTGEYINNWQTASYFYGGISVASDGSILLASTDASSASYMARYSNSGSLLNTYTPYGTQRSSYMVQGGDGFVYSADYSGKYMLRYFLGGGSYSNFYGPTANITGYTYQMAARGSEGYVIDTSARTIVPFASSLTLSTSTPINMSSAFNVFDGIAFGHGNNLYISGIDAVGGKIMRYNSATKQTSGIVANSAGYGEFTSIAVVVAPEPASYLALGLGAVVLLRRKRSR